MPPTGGSAMQACLGPSYRLLEFSQDIFLNFLDVTGYSGNPPDRSQGINYEGMLVKSEDAYLGDITITLFPGLDIRIPNYQFVTLDPSVNTEGTIVEANSSSREILINSLEGTKANHIPIFDMPFFSTSYLFVDQARDEFALWRGDPTATEEKLIPISPVTACVDSPSSRPTSASTSIPSSGDTRTDRNMSAGVIAGVVIGSFAALVLVLFLLLYYLRHRHHLSEAPASIPEKADPRLSSYLAFKPEMPTDRQPPLEMPVEGRPAYAVWPYEMAEKEQRVRVEPTRWELGNKTPKRHSRVEMS
ncbi:MAG: hypothetical protein Q9170_007582 [Blastenia crenularia]